MITGILLFLCLGMPAAGTTPATMDAFWVFDKDGVKVYSKDGSTLVKHIENTDMCLESVNSKTGEKEQNCKFYDAQSDGKQYVLATNTQGGSFVEVFSVTTGMHIASIPTCSFPYYIDVAPFRDEAWVHCWSPKAENGDEGHVDIFSTNVWGLNHMQVNIAGGELQSHGHGLVRLNNAIPNYAYATMLDTNALKKVNVHTREVTTLWLNQSVGATCNGVYRMEISSVNRHAFLRCYVCCTCGIDGDTKKECSSRAGDVTLPDGSTAKGHCGHSCEGTAADNVGVLEYDLVGESLLGAHISPGNVGAANPYVSPKGDFLVLLSNDGTAAKIVKIGSNGVLSNDAAASDVQVGYQSGGTANTISGVAFIEDGTYDMVMFTSTMDDFVVVADLRDVRQGRTVQSSQVQLTGTSNHGRGAKRLVVWAEGSRYAMTHSNKEDKIHVLDLGATGDIRDVRLLRTLENTPAKFMIYVPAWQGTLGEQGLQGLRGVQGLQGDRGIQGSQGSRGAQGEHGKQGLPGISSDSQPVEPVVIICIVLTVFSIGVSVGTSILTFKKAKAMMPATAALTSPDTFGIPATEIEKRGDESPHARHADEETTL